MGTPLLWIAFNLFVLAAVALDLFVFGRRLHKIGLREAAIASLGWIVLATLFGLAILHFSGHERGIEFFTGYLVEKALSVDNLFLFLVIFRTFAVDERYQHRLLEWGILGALVMRGIMIAAGAVLIQQFSWIMYVLGAFLVYAGIHMLFTKKESIHPDQNPIFKFASRHLRVTRGYHGEHFFVRSIGRLYATPLFLVLMVVEITDITLAVDSIPAVFGITKDPFIVYTSNVFAILGLRALYFLLAGVMNRMRFLTGGLSAVLLFIGAKMIADPWFPLPDYLSLAIVAGILLIAIGASLLFPAKAVATQPVQKTIAAPTPSAAKPLSADIASLAANDAAARIAAAQTIYSAGRKSAEGAVASWWTHPELSQLLSAPNPIVTVGVAVHPETFARIRQANNSPRLANVPPDQDAQEFELHFPQNISMDILTTKSSAASGAIARYLSKLGEGIQQVEFRCKNVDLATQILREQFGISAVYPQMRDGADGTRINFFLMPLPDGAKILIELYEPATDIAPQSN